MESHDSSVELTCHLWLFPWQQAPCTSCTLVLRLQTFLLPVLSQNSEGMDQNNPGQSQTQEDSSTGAAATPEAVSAADSTAAQPAAPSRPQRPQRSAKVEGSIDISEPKTEPTDIPAPLSNQEDCIPDGVVASRPKPSRQGGPKGPGHHPVRAASVPHPPASRSVPPHLNPHAQRALSVAGTADSQALTVEDFRQVSLIPVYHSVPVSACLCLSFPRTHRER